MSVGLIALLVLAASTATPPGPIGACAGAPLLSRYANPAGPGLTVRAIDGGRVEIAMDLHIDLHARDCGSADCYGTDVRVLLIAKPKGTRCHLESARVETKDFRSSGCAATEEPVNGHKALPFELERKDYDLADPTLARVVLRNAKVKEALSLLSTSFFFYEDVPRAATLLDELPGEGNPVGSCCYGATSTLQRPLLDIAPP